MADFEPKYQNLVELYQRSVESFSTNPLFGTKKGDQWVWMTYGEFGEKVDAMRGALAQIGIEKGDRVAVIADNRPEWAIAAYAAYGLGAGYVPMYESMLDKDWKYILNDCGAKALIVANGDILARCAAFKDELSTLETLVVMDDVAKDGAKSFDQMLKLGSEHPKEAIHPEPSDMAGLIYTSGTTGNPKGVLLSHKNLANNVSAIHVVFPIAAEDRSLSFLPWAHSFGQTVELHGLLSMGASMGIAESVSQILPNLLEVKPTLLFSVPRIFNRIYDSLHKKMDEAGGLKKALFEAAIANAQRQKALAEEGKSSGWADFKAGIFDKLVFAKVRERFGGRLKYAFSGGAALSKEVAAFVDDLGIKVYEGYGLTETSPIATVNFPGNRKIGSVGKAIPGVTIEIDRSVTDDPKHGEIVVHGHNVMQGYYGLEEENAKVFTGEGPERGFRTGDMGYVDADGYLYITGRIKEQYKLLNGKYVVPSPLEEKLKLSTFISNVMVHGMNEEFNVALVVPDFETLDRWASEHGLDPKDHKALVKQEQVHELFQKELDAQSTGFKQYEKVRKFLIIPEDFTVDNGMLTPTLKLKRRIVLETWADAIADIYKQGK